METRVDIAQLEPEAYQALLKLSQLANLQISKSHQELIKIRSSQINGCAFCINMHTKEARKNGETEARIYLLNAWKEVNNLYSEEEKVILAFTEEITLIANGGLSTATYNKAKAFFDDHYIAKLMLAVITINAWNRIAIATHMQPEF